MGSVVPAGTTRTPVVSVHVNKSSARVAGSAKAEPNRRDKARSLADFDAGIVFVFIGKLQGKGLAGVDVAGASVSRWKKQQTKGTETGRKMRKKCKRKAKAERSKPEEPEKPEKSQKGAGKEPEEESEGVGRRLIVCLKRYEINHLKR